MNFFEYLSDNGLYFDTSIVEDFLISLKSKQFLILSGGSGTGKTRIAQAYGKFISKAEKPQKSIDIDVSLGKADTNGGFFLKREQFFSAVPKKYQALDGEYKFTIDGMDSVCNIQMSPRLTYKKGPEKDKITKYLSKLKETKDKTTLTLWLNSNDISENNQYAIIPVGSNWTDNRHILGYMNALTGKYVSTPPLDLMIHSESDCSNPYLMILDEMNLSHVERYFSDVLSAMESRDPIDLGCSDEDFPKTVSVPENLFVIGTVNMDETTYMFSPKVLDRANVIEFEPASISKFLTSSHSEYSPAGNVEYLQDCMNGLDVRELSSKSIILEISKNSANKKYVEEMTEHLQKLQDCMSSINLPFGYRTVEEFMRFMYVAWTYENKNEFVNWKRYFDSQIKQKILPKIHGNMSIRDGLLNLETFCKTNGYVRSDAKLARMIEVLDGQRYVSFNC